MASWLRILIGIIVVVLIGVGGLFLFQMSQGTSNDYDTIAQHWTKGGKFIDYAKDLGVEGINDMHYFVNKEEKTVEIGYGYVQLIYTWEELKTDDIKAKLKYIGLTYDIHKDGNKFRFYWQGVEMEPWYRSNIVG